MTGSLGLSKGLTVSHCAISLQTFVRLIVFSPTANIFSPLQGNIWLKEFRCVLEIPLKVQTIITYYESALVLTQMK